MIVKTKMVEASASSIVKTLWSQSLMMRRTHIMRQVLIAEIKINITKILFAITYLPPDTEFSHAFFYALTDFLPQYENVECNYYWGP